MGRWVDKVDQHPSVGWLLPALGLIVTPLLFVSGNQLADSSNPWPRDAARLLGTAPHLSRAVTLSPGAGKPPQFLPASCAPQAAVTVVPSDTPTVPVTPPNAVPSGVPVLDQAQLQCTGGLSMRGNPTQTFTVGRSGQLTRVDIPLCAPAANARIDLTISTTDGSGHARTASLKLPRDFSDCAWYEFDYNQPLAVAVGAVLQLQATMPHHKSALWGYAGLTAPNGTSIDVYPGGQGQWRGVPIEDFAFQTYVR